MAFDIRKFKNDLKVMIEECDHEISIHLKDNEFLEAFELQNAKDAFNEIKIRTAGLDSEKTILELIEGLLADYRRNIKSNKKAKNSLYCKVCSDKIREIEDNVLNEIRLGTYDA